MLANNTLTAVRYWDKILKANVRSYTGVVGPGFLLVDDNAHPYVATVSKQFLDDKGINAIDWLARPPDLKPTENLRDIMYCTKSRSSRQSPRTQSAISSKALTSDGQIGGPLSCRV